MRSRRILSSDEEEHPIGYSDYGDSYRSICVELLVFSAMCFLNFATVVATTALLVYYDISIWIRTPISIIFSFLVMSGLLELDHIYLRRSGRPLAEAGETL